jgi:hypothetical protein
MIERILAFSVRRRWFVLRFTIAAALPQAVGRRRWCSKAIVRRVGRRGKFVDAVNYSAARKSVFGAREVV